MNKVQSKLQVQPCKQKKLTMQFEIKIDVYVRLGDLSGGELILFS